MMEDTLQQIDNIETQKEVERKLRQYRTYILTVPERKTPKVTVNYTLEMPNFSLERHSSTEATAIENVDLSVEREKFFHWIAKGLRKLNNVERKIIVLKYLQMEPMYNYEIYSELQMSESKFYRHRAKALYKLALALGIEKYTDKEHTA